MLQFDANAHTNVDASVNGPLLEKKPYPEFDLTYIYII